MVTQASEPHPPGGQVLSSRRRFSALAAILLLAAAARVVVILATPHYHPLDDAADYDSTAVSLVAHGTYPPSGVGGPAALRPPAFPYLLAAVDKVVGIGSATTRWDAGRIAQAVLGVIIVALIVLVARRLWGARAALVAGAIAAVYPPLLLAGSSLMTEPLFIVCSLGAVLVALRGRSEDRGRLTWAALAGLLCGLTSLTRDNGIIVAIPVALLMWDVRPRLSRRGLAAPVVVVVATLLTVAPWAIRNTVVFGQFTPLGTESGYALSGTYTDAARLDKREPALWRPLLGPISALHRAHPHWNEAQIGNQLTSDAIRYAKRYPSYVLEVVYRSALRMLNLPGPALERELAPVWSYPRGLAVASVYAFWVCGILALVGVASATTRRAPRALWLVPVVLLLPSLFFEGLTRYRVPADPYILMLTSLGVLTLVGRLSRRPSAGTPRASARRPVAS